MKLANLTEFKNNLSRYVDCVRQGETIRILVRGVPAADLIPVSESVENKASLERQLADLERRGLIRRRGSGRIPDEILDEPAPAPDGMQLSEYVTEERRSGK